MRSHLKSTFLRIALLPALVLLSSNLSFGQAVFQVSSSASTVNNIGHLEKAGTMTFIVISGVTAAGTIEATFPTAITNTTTTGITVSGTAGLAGSTLGFVAASSGIVSINVPAGAGVGASVSLSGVRVSMVGLTVPLNATVSTTGNSVVAGQNVVAAINSSKDGFGVVGSTGSSFTHQNGVLVSAPGVFTVTEGFASSFSSSIGVLGQTTATQVIFRVVGLPNNVSITFPAVITAPSGATLTTLSATAETLTNDIGTDLVTYVFTDSITSPTIVDEFSVLPTVGTIGIPQTGTAFIQAALGPIGAVQPNAEFPSTAIPRFAARFLPEINVPQPMPVRFFFPISTAATAQSIVISNTSSGGASITFFARREDGAAVSGTDLIAQNEITMLAGETRTLTLAQLFGTAANSGNIASVEVVSQNDRVLVSASSTLAGGRVVAANQTVSTQMYLPFDRSSFTDVPALALHNSGTAAGSVALTMRTESGQALFSASRAIAVGGSVRSNLTTLFGAAAADLPLTGYVTVDSTVALRGTLTNHPALNTDQVPGVLAVNRASTIFPFFAFGAGYSTVLSLINGSATSNAQVTLTPYQSDGTLLAGVTPAMATIAPRARANFNFGSLFAAGAGIKTGYFILTVQTIADNPFSSLPRLAGTVRVSTAAASTVAPLVLDPGTEFYITPTAATSSLYTGFALVNDGSTALSVTIQSYSPTGALLGTATVPLAGKSLVARLLRELVPASLAHDGGYVRVTSTGQINLVIFRGNLMASELIHVRAQTLP